MTKQAGTHSGATLTIDVAPDGRLCTGGADRLLKLWKPDGSAIKQLPPLDDWIYSACFDASGKHVIAGTWTGRVHVFTTDAAQSVWQFDTNPATPDQPAADASVSLRARGGDSDPPHPALFRYAEFSDGKRIFLSTFAGFWVFSGPQGSANRH